MHLNSLLLFEKYGRRYFHREASVLEIGPDEIPSTFEVASPSVRKWDTTDLWHSHEYLNRRGQFPSIRMPDEYTIPIADSTYDIVLSGQVIEHVRRIWDWMLELERVVKPGGLVITIGPWSWPYHAVPIDCWRIHEEGPRSLYKHAGLEVMEVHSESIESTRTRRTYPGHTPEPSRGVVSDSLRRFLGWPSPTPIDTIGIGRKL